MSLQFVCKGPINKLPALVQKMALHRTGDSTLSEPMRVRSLTHICFTLPQLVLRIHARTHGTHLDKNILCLNESSRIHATIKFDSVSFHQLCKLSVEVRCKLNSIYTWGDIATLILIHRSRWNYCQAQRRGSLCNLRRRTKLVCFSYAYPTMIQNTSLVYISMGSSLGCMVNRCVRTICANSGTHTNSLRAKPYFSSILFLSQRARIAENVTIEPKSVISSLDVISINIWSKLSYRRNAMSHTRADFGV